MLKKELEQEVERLQAALEVAQAATQPAEEPVWEATVLFGVRNLETNQTNWFAREGCTREEAQAHADEHAHRIGRRFEVTFYAKQGTERERN